MDKKQEEKLVPKTEAPAPVVAKEVPKAAPKYATKEVYLITRPPIEGDWRPHIELVSADDPRAVISADSIVLEK